MNHSLCSPPDLDVYCTVTAVSRISFHVQLPYLTKRRLNLRNIMVAREIVHLEYKPLHVDT
jgi:hypothetical protein